MELFQRAPTVNLEGTAPQNSHALPWRARCVMRRITKCQLYWRSDGAISTVTAFKISNNQRQISGSNKSFDSGPCNQLWNGTFCCRGNITKCCLLVQMDPRGADPSLPLSVHPHEHREVPGTPPLPSSCRRLRGRRGSSNHCSQWRSFVAKCKRAVLENLLL